MPYVYKYGINYYIIIINKRLLHMTSILTFIAILFIVFGIMRVLKVYGWEVGAVNVVIGIMGLIAVNTNLIL